MGKLMTNRGEIIALFGENFENHGEIRCGKVADVEELNENLGKF
jgi:hypothetical protein